MKYLYFQLSLAPLTLREQDCSPERKATVTCQTKPEIGVTGTLFKVARKSFKQPVSSWPVWKHSSVLLWVSRDCHLGFLCSVTSFFSNYKICSFKTMFCFFVCILLLMLVGPTLWLQMMNSRPSEELEIENKTLPHRSDPRNVKGTPRTEGFLRQNLKKFAANEVHHFQRVLPLAESPHGNTYSRNPDTWIASSPSDTSSFYSEE